MVTRPETGLRLPQARVGRRQALAAAALAALVLLVVGLVAALGGGEPEATPAVPVGGDPLAFDPSSAAELERAAAFAYSHILYTKSPGGVVATAKRTTRFRPLVEAAAAGSGVDPDMLEAIVFLESAGRPNVIAGGDLAGAAGLTQIVAETGTGFLGMEIDIEASARLTRRIAAAQRGGDSAAVRRLRERRRAVDPRFAPAQALAATVRYLETARARLGRDDLAVVSYHMGIGNLERVLRGYAAVEGSGPTRGLVAERDLSYARVFFDSSPTRHADAWLGLRRLGDSSRDYYWRVLAAAEIMRLYRENPARLARLDRLHGAKASAEEVLHPRRTTERFADPDELAAAWKAGKLVPIPADAATAHVVADPRMGELAPDLEAEAALYRGLRPEALALLLYLADRVYEVGRSSEPLLVTSTVRDDTYQALLVQTNAEATRRYSLHTTGYAFDIARIYASGAQQRAFQYELERLAARGLIAWVREPAVIHVTVSRAAAVLIPALPGSGGEPAPPSSS